MFRTASSFNRGNGKVRPREMERANVREQGASGDRGPLLEPSF